MLDNIHYLKHSINNQEKLLDDCYIFSEWDKNIEKYVKDTKKLKEILTTINTLKNKNLIVNDSLYMDIIKLLNSYANKSELACFLTACDCNLENINQENLDIVKSIVDIFLEKRGICEFTYKEWLQAILDSGASRKKGKCGENKLIDISKKFNYQLVSTIQDLLNNKKAIAKFTKNGEFSIGNLKNSIGIDLDFNNQNKILDVLIKNNDQYFFIEAKHLKTSGGDQNKQMTELINIIKKDTKNRNFHFVAFLDGNYSNYLLNNLKINKDDLDNKLSKQRQEIIETLKLNKNNLWLNTYGFTELLKDLN